jgi:hypothetical protein
MNGQVCVSENKKENGKRNGHKKKENDNNNNKRTRRRKLVSVGRKWPAYVLCLST